MKITIDKNFLYKKNRLQQIKGFYYTARSRSISEAARVMNLTQSTVTLQIQSLERDLGLKLLKRDSKPISLTAEGKDFYQLACPLMHEFESIVEKFLSDRNKKEQKKIDIAVHHIAISYLMPSIISNFKEIHPDAKIIIRNIAPSEAMKRLKEGQIDLAFYPNIHREAEIKQIDTVSYDPILIMNKNHHLIQKQIKTLKDLKFFDLIRIDQGLITLPLFEEAVKTHRIKGSIEFENGNWEILKHFIRANNLAAVVSTICIDKKDSDLAIRNLSKFFPKMSYSIAHKKGQILKPFVEDFIKTVCETVKK